MTDDLHSMRVHLREANDELEYLREAHEREKGRADRLWALIDMLEISDGALRFKEGASLDPTAWLGEVGAEMPF